MNPLNDVQAAKFLGLSVSTLRNWRFLSRGPAYHLLGRRIVYFQDDLEAYIAAHRVDPEGSITPPAHGVAAE